MMRPGLSWPVALLAWLFLVPFCAYGQDETTTETQEIPEFKIIVHAENPAKTMSAKALSRIFLKKTRRWDEEAWGRRVKVSPHDLPEKSDVRKLFTRAVHNKSTSAIKSYWQRELFSGRDVPPPELPDDEEMMKKIAADEGAIGYVSGDAELPANLKVLEVKDE